MAINGSALIGWTLTLKIATRVIWFPHLHTEYSQYHARKGKFVTYRNKSGVRNQNRKLLASDIVYISNNQNTMMDFEWGCIKIFNVKSVRVHRVNGNNFLVKFLTTVVVLHTNFGGSGEMCRCRNYSLSKCVLCDFASFCILNIHVY
jgi:hypothetical protein